MERDNYDLIALLQKVPTATVSLQLSDLNAFSRRLIAQTREEYEREITGRLESRNEVYLSSDAVKQTLKISNTTLWRWAKAGMLVPVMVGGQKRYRQSDIDKLVELRP
ncbi:MAG: helix-turn-helix domain-containing protein [bacterium]|nr:helix-turn-helix domain-containing protein [Candidatus Minthenecus merdequi]